MKRILPIILALVGLAAGTGAGFLLRPDTKPDAAATSGRTAAKGNDGIAPSETSGAASENPAQGNDTPANDTGAGAREYVKLDNQFVVPVVDDKHVTALVVLSLSMEVTQGSKQVVFDREPRLRDALLQALFRHANSGGFDGKFTAGQKMLDLRGELLEAAHKVLGPTVTRVLIDDIVRQDV